MSDHRIPSSAHPRLPPYLIVTGAAPHRLSADLTDSNRPAHSLERVGAPPSALERHALRLNDASRGVDDAPTSANGPMNAPVPPAFASSRAYEMKSTVELVTGMFEAAAVVKQGYLTERTNATKLMNQFYSDLMATTAQVDQLFAVAGSEGGMTLSKDRALSYYAQFYMKWMGTPIGEVKAGVIDERQWLQFSDNIEFRVIHTTENRKPVAKKYAFIALDKLTDSLLKPIGINASTQALFSPDSISPKYQKENIVLSFLADAFLKFSKTDHYINGPEFINKRWVENLPEAMEKVIAKANLTGADHISTRIFLIVFEVLKRTEPGSPNFYGIYRKNRDIAKWLENPEKPHQFNSSQVSQIRKAADIEQNAWQQVSGAMLQTAQQAQSLSDRMYQLLTEMARSMFDVDKQFVTSN